jgi:IclR family acetate operon transcriptional repressor
MPKRTASEPSSIQSLGRGLSILEAVAGSPAPVPLKDLTALLGIDRSSVYRLADTLRQRRFLANPAGRKDYILGPSVWCLSRRYGQSLLVTVAREHLRALSTETGETAHLAVRDGALALFIDHHVAEGQVVTVSGQTGELVPLHATAHGKALLSGLDSADLDRVFGTKALRAHTKRTVPTTGQLARMCAQIQARGFATDDGEFVEELRCVAAPIRDGEGVIVASIGISAPLSRFPRTRYAVCASQVLSVAEAVTAALGV